MASNVLGGVIAFGDNFDGIKVVSTLLCIWGFSSYLNEMYIKKKEEKEEKEEKKEDDSSEKLINKDNNDDDDSREKMTEIVTHNTWGDDFLVKCQVLFLLAVIVCHHAFLF